MNAGSSTPMYLLYLFDAKTPAKQATARNLWDRACRKAAPVLSTQVLQEFFATVTKTLKQGVPVTAAREAVFVFSDTADVVSVSVPLIVAATRRLETSNLSFWDSLIIESAIGSGARCLWTKDLQDGQAFGELVIMNPFKSPTR